MSGFKPGALVALKGERFRKVYRVTRSHATDPETFVYLRRWSHAARCWTGELRYRLDDGWTEAPAEWPQTRAARRGGPER